MCSRLHLMTDSGPMYIAPGDSLTYTPAGADKAEAGKWGIQMSDKINGFARVETFDKKWLPYGWRPCTVELKDFAEGHEKQIWAGKSGLVAALHKDGVVLIITRQAKPVENRFFSHHRVPVQVINHKMVLPQKSGRPWVD